jgi:uncharacterized membrane protein YtjA (UPF0391 family)
VPLFSSNQRLCSNGIRKFRGFQARNHQFRAGLFRQARRDQSRRGKLKTEVWIMLSWVVTFLVIALIAGILGFGGIAGASIEIAKAIFFIAIILFLVSAVIGLARGRTRV